MHPDRFLAVVRVQEAPSPAAVAFDYGLAELHAEMAGHLDDTLYMEGSE